jgi:hypothetical protein
VKGTCKTASILFLFCWSLPGSTGELHSHGQTNESPKKIYELINGRWFNGREFQPYTLYSANGILTGKRPRGDIETIDLGNHFVLPPFAEAHNHNLGGALYLNRDFTQQMIQRYLAAGIFYVKIPGNPAKNAASLRSELVNRADSVDVAFANGVLTSPDGHPQGMLRDSFKEAGIALPPLSEFEGDGFYIIESETELLAKWPRILAGKPDFIKTILCHSEDLQQRRANPKLFGYNGLDPKILPRIVKQAHDAGLRVSTHVYSAADFAVAVEAGVDEINHLPGIRFEEGKSESDYLISPGAARRAGNQGVIVVATANLARSYATGAALAAVQAAQRKNIEMLKRNGVRMAIGSDNYSTTSLEEVMYLKSLDVFSNLELLNMWSVNSAETIHPRRKIGQLREGYEASFIVLRGNPLENFDHVKDIRQRFKQGRLLDTAQ